MTRCCRQCGTKTPPMPSNPRRRRVFCSDECDRAWRREQWKGNRLRAGRRPSNSFQPGESPWNKGLAGIHLSPDTEFKPGPRPELRARIGMVRKRQSRRDRKRRAYIKVQQPNRWRLRCHVVWEQAHGPITTGFLIHHKDRDTLNDDLDNLELMNRADHLNEHRPEFEKKRARHAVAARWGKPHLLFAKRKIG